MIEHINGAKWWKFDFHNHTPASNDFGKGDPTHKAITTQNWLLMYMRENIDCVAITDHNSGAWIDILKETLLQLDATKPPGYRKLYLFPGVEITATSNTHILAIFPTTATKEDISALLGAVEFPVVNFGTSDAVANKTVEKIIDEIHKVNAIAIPAHVDKASGLFTRQEGNTLKQILETDGLLAIEVIDKLADKPELYKQSKLRLTEVIGSDSHIAAQVGTNYTWVKMGEPSLEALKLALHDGEDAVHRHDEIAGDPNIIPNCYFIKSISVSKGFRAGNKQPIIAKFSPWLTSIIGGRGAGKSTVINYLRIALNKASEMPDTIQEDFDRFNQIGKKEAPGMLRHETTIDVEIVKDGRLQKVTWNYAERKHKISFWDSIANIWSDENEVTNIHELYPAQIFSQKELYALTNDTSKLFELIDSQFNKKRWAVELQDLMDVWLAKRSRSRSLQSQIENENNLKAEIALIENQIQLYERSAYNTVLGNFNLQSSINKFFSDTYNTVAKFSTLVASYPGTTVKIDVPEHIEALLDRETKLYIGNLQKAIAEINEKFMEANELLKPYNENLSAILKTLPWYEAFESAKNAYGAVEIQIKEICTDTYEHLITKRDAINNSLADLEINKIAQKDLKSELKSLLIQIIDKEKELRTLRRSVIDRWKGLDDSVSPFLLIELEPMADKDQAIVSFRQIIRKSGGEFADYIYGEDDDKSWGVISNIINEPESTRWENRLTHITHFVDASFEDKRGLETRLVKHIQSLKEHTPEDLDRLMVWVPEDKIVLKFKKEDQIQDIQTGSAGERTAGMLGLILALNDAPLIIDQPEDDLDSKLISNFVVPGFKRLKKRRQLILVTHNPNISVNANSDNIIYMGFISGEVGVVANNALQNLKIREAVCDVMEGGRDALDKRYFRISKALRS